MPLFALAFGNYTDGFTAVDAMSEARAAAIKFVYLSMAVFVAFYLQAACWIRTGNRQASSMRLSFVKAVMRQDVAFFENHTSTGTPRINQAKPSSLAAPCAAARLCRCKCTQASVVLPHSCASPDSSLTGFHRAELGT